MAQVTARLLNEKANKYCEEVQESYFHHTFSPDWCYCHVQGAFWIDSVYGFRYTEEKQYELLGHALHDLEEGVDYILEVREK